MYGQQTLTTSIQYVSLINLIPNNKSKKQRPKRAQKPRKNFKGGPTSLITDRQLQKTGDNRVVTVVKLVDKGAITSSTSVDTLGGFAFSLSDLNEVTSFTNLFDQYKIIKIQVELIPLTIPATMNATGAFYSTALLMAIDYDDSGTPASLQVVKNYQNVRIIPPGTQRVYKFAFEPHMALAAYSGSFTSYANLKPRWIDASSTGVVHYGLKYGVATSAVQVQFQVLTRYVVQFRNVR